MCGRGEVLSPSVIYAVERGSALVHWQVQGCPALERGIGVVGVWRLFVVGGEVGG